jgi:MerR family transcriptional regulator, light-induced transcriptional regulator
VEVQILTNTHSDPDQPVSLLPIGAVVAELRRTYADVSHSSLRFLEREGLVEATRTPGGHRLYAPSDIERIIQIKKWQQERLSLDDIRQRLADLDDLPAPAALAERFLREVLDGNLAAAHQTIVVADEVGMPLARIFGDVLQPALAEVGDRWEDGRLLVAQEKEISELARDLIAELSLRHARVNPEAPRLVAACVAGERHELGLRMLSGLLRASGYGTHYLGADVDHRFLLDAVRLHRPDAVLLSAKLDVNLPAIREAMDVVRTGMASGDMPPIIVGGDIVPAHAPEIRSWGAIPIASEPIADSVQAITALLASEARKRVDGEGHS